MSWEPGPRGPSRLETLVGQHQRFRSAGISLWVNTLDPVSHGGFTDSAALGDPDAVWGRLIEAGVSVIQIDERALSVMTSLLRRV